jgi:hypothetical protein
MPALRHLLVAIVLLDEFVAEPSTHVVQQRYRAILFHYNKAIGQLARGHAPSPLELAMSSMLGWLLEAMSPNADMAHVHLTAARKIIVEGLPHSQTDIASHGEEIFCKLPAALELCNGYDRGLSNHRIQRVPMVRDPLLVALQNRRGPPTVSRCEELYSFFRDLFDVVIPDIHHQTSVKAGYRCLSQLRTNILRFRYHADVHWSVIFLCYLITGLAQTLISSADESVQMSEEDVWQAAEYISARAQDLSRIEIPEHDALMRRKLMHLIDQMITQHFTSKCVADSKI